LIGREITHAMATAIDFAYLQRYHIETGLNTPKSGFGRSEVSLRDLQQYEASLWEEFKTQKQIHTQLDAAAILREYLMESSLQSALPEVQDGKEEQNSLKQCLNKEHISRQSLLSEIVEKQSFSERHHDENGRMLEEYAQLLRPMEGVKTRLQTCPESVAQNRESDLDPFAQNGASDPDLISSSRGLEMKLLRQKKELEDDAQKDRLKLGRLRLQLQESQIAIEQEQGVPTAMAMQTSRHRFGLPQTDVTVTKTDDARTEVYTIRAEVNGDVKSCEFTGFFDAEGKLSVLVPTIHGHGTLGPTGIPADGVRNSSELGKLEILLRFHLLGLEALQW